MSLAQHSLQDYIDHVNTSMIHFGYVSNPLPWRYIRTKINSVREHVAEVTRCLNHYYETVSLLDIASYIQPDVMIDALDVWYDGNLINRKTDDYMNRVRQHTISAGTPYIWAFYGGRGQWNSYIYLYPTPNTADLVIRVHAVVLPEPLVKLSELCELPHMIYSIVEEGVRLELLRELPRPPRDLQVMTSRWERKLAGKSTLKAK